MPEPLQVLFECHTFPPHNPARRLGMQEGKEVVQDVPFEDQSQIRFQFSVLAEVDPSGTVIYRGKYVQGKRDEPFVYLCWGERAGAVWQPYGRSKIPLSAIPPALVQRSLQTGQPLRARIALTDPRGNPALATLKPSLVEWLDT